jgi:hypothetical protein
MNQTKDIVDQIIRNANIEAVARQDDKSELTDVINSTIGNLSLLRERLIASRSEVHGIDSATRDIGGHFRALRNLVEGLVELDIDHNELLDTV